MSQRGNEVPLSLRCRTLRQFSRFQLDFEQIKQIDWFKAHGSHKKAAKTRTVPGGPGPKFGSGYTQKIREFGSGRSSENPACLTCSLELVSHFCHTLLKSPDFMKLISYRRHKICPVLFAFFESSSRSFRYRRFFKKRRETLPCRKYR